MSQSLIAFDTDHIKGYVFGTNKLKEIRGASSILDSLNRVVTVDVAKNKYGATKIYANGGAALFKIDSDKAVALGQEVQRLYHEQTGGGASITYAIQPIPDYNGSNIMTDKLLSDGVTMKDVLKLLSLRLRLAKDSLQMTGPQEQRRETYIAFPSHALLCTCDSCGMQYAEEVMRDRDTDEEGRYCRVCKGKREKDAAIKGNLQKDALWERILDALKKYNYSLSLNPEHPTERPTDFNVFRQFSDGKDYLGLVYADANNMGKAIEQQETLKQVAEFADSVDNAVFDAMADAISQYLSVIDGKFPFDILMIGGDDIAMVTPADKAMQVAHALATKFHKETDYKYTLSVGVVLAPVKYPFNLQRLLVDETLKAARKKGAEKQTETVATKNEGNAEDAKETGKGKQEQSRINFVVVTGNTSLNYSKIYDGMYRKQSNDEFYATMRPYSLNDLDWLLKKLRDEKARRLGRTKLHQLREAILKRNRTNTILESLALLRNWKKDEREFVKDMVRHFDRRVTGQQKDMGTLFPWSLDGTKSNIQEHIYFTPLLDFIELYDFVSS